MSRPPEQHNTISSRWWVRLCQWLWARRQFVWSTLIAGFIVGIGVNWLTSTSIFTSTPLGTGLQWVHDHLLVAGFIGVCLLFLTLLVGAVSHLAGTSVRPAATASDLQRNRSALIRLLRNEYRRQLAESLQGHAMMTLALEQRTDVVLSSVSLVSWRMDAPGELSLPAPASIVQAYDDAGSSLLILGAPGAGKSTLLRELANELIIRAEQDVAQPVPVIVNLSSWAIKKPPLTMWLVDQLQLVYAIPRHLSQTWTEQDQLLLLLDGLDEVEPSARTSCIEAINAYRAEHFVPLVVCSRSREYLEQEKQLRLPVAVEVRPLTAEQVETYLKGMGKPMAAVHAALKSNAIMRDLVTTPLMFSVVMLAYRGKTVKDLPHLGSAEDQQRQVFDHYAIRVLESRARKWHYTSHQTRQWLIWLAHQMQQHSMKEFYLERLQPTWLPTKRSQIVYTLLNKLCVGLLFGLLSGLFGGPFVALVVALVVALAVILFDRKDWEIQPSEKLALSWNLSWQILGSMGVYWLFIMGMATAIVYKQSGIQSSQLFSRLIGLGVTLSALLFLLVLILVNSLFNAQIDEHMRLRPNQGIHTSGWNILRRGLVGGLVGGLFSWLLINGLVNGLIGGLLSWLLIGLLSGGRAYLQHYCLRYVLRQSGAMPWHYVRFLEETTERILLQRVGGGYRFIHPLFQEYFASLGTPTPPPSQQP